METRIDWLVGEGAITATYEGSGNGSAVITSDVNEGIDREQTISVSTVDESLSVDVVVKQTGLREVFILSDGNVFNGSDTGFWVIKGKDTIFDKTYVTGSNEDNYQLYLYIEGLNVNSYVFEKPIIINGIECYMFANQTGVFYLYPDYESYLKNENVFSIGSSGIYVETGSLEPL